MSPGRKRARIIGVILALGFAVCAGAQAPDCETNPDNGAENLCQPDETVTSYSLAWHPLWGCVPGSGGCGLVSAQVNNGGEGTSVE